MKQVDSVCRPLYELAILLTGVVACLAPFHHLATHNINVGRVLDASHFVFAANETFRIQPGEWFPVYRFHEAWDLPIGRARIEHVRGTEVTAWFDPSQARWPLGRSGRVVALEPAGVRVDIGAALGFRPRDRLVLFNGRRRVGAVELTEVSNGSSVARVLEGPARHLVGLTATEYAVATQVTAFRSPAVSFVEVLVFAVAVVGYLWGTLVLRRPLFSLFGQWLRRHARAPTLPGAKVCLHLLAGIPSLWLLTNVSRLLLARLLVVLATLVHLDVGSGSLLPGLRWWGRAYSWSMYLVGGLWYAVHFAKTRRSPLVALWKRVSYANHRPQPSGTSRPLMVWLLHLVIAYVFGTTLCGFLQANLREMIVLAWSGVSASAVDPWQLLNPQVFFFWLASCAQMVGHMLTHPPHLASVETTFRTLNLLVWSITVASCLIGYGHSILSCLWGKWLRRVDFTIMGWLVNGLCYSRIFGFAVWQTIANRFIGPDPIITQGALHYWVLSIGLCLNFLYMLTIWNLGVMFGVMTDKGVRTSAFYSVVRHPSYTLEACMGFVFWVGGASTGLTVLALGLLFLLYYLRSEREDDFLSYSNPSYPRYKARTPFKYVPGIC